MSGRICFVLLVMLVGCASSQNWLPSAGASRAQIQDLAQAQPASNIQVVEINERVRYQPDRCKRKKDY